MILLSHVNKISMYQCLFVIIACFPTDDVNRVILAPTSSKDQSHYINASFIQVMIHLGYFFHSYNRLLIYTGL